MSTVVERLADRLKSEVAARSSALAEQTFQQGLTLDEAAFCSALKKKGVLRCSAYEFNPQTLKRVIRGILKDQTVITKLAPETCAYFESIDALLVLGESCQTTYQAIVRGLKADAVKACIASVDYLFWFPPMELQELSMSFSNNGFSMESHASALSTYIYELSSRGLLDDVNVGLMEECKAVSGYHLTNLGELASLARFREAEVMVDCLNYSATVKGRKVLIRAHCPDFEKALRHGFIHFASQKVADSANLMLQIKGYRFDEFCKTLYERLGDQLVTLCKHPVERIVIGLPGVDSIRQLIDGDLYFTEEIAEVTSLAKELLLQPNQVAEADIAAGLTILDIFKFQRLFSLLLALFKRYVKYYELERTPLLYRSMVPVYRAEGLKSLLEGLFGVDKATAYLTTFTWDHSAKSMFDIQTQPLLKFGKHYVVPLGIVAGSNLVRNHLMRTGFRFDATSEEDPVGDLLVSAFEGAKATVKRNTSFSHGDSEGEVDVLAQIGDDVFACECKNSLHPCNSFEIRTSYDYIQKGARQMHLFARAFADSTFRTSLGQRLGLVFTRNTRLHTCIVTGNRMFSGWRESGFPVRPLYEMCNFIKTGEIKFKASGGVAPSVRVMKVKLWKGDQFSPEDLVDYIEHNSMHAPLFSAMKPWNINTDIGRKTLVLESFLMDPVEEVKQVASAFRVTFSQEQNPFADVADVANSANSAIVGCEKADD